MAVAFIKQSTAYTFRFGPFNDSTDGFTEENSLTIAASAVLLAKAGGAFAAKNDATALTGTGANGHYTCVLNTTDTNTVGALRAYSNIAGALPVWADLIVLPAQVFDSLIGGTDVLQVDVSQFGNAAGTFAAGRPETNATHIAGSSVSTSTAQIGVNVVNFGGAAGTFASGRPEVNSTHFAGTAYATALAAEVDAVWDEQVDGTTTGRQSMRLHNSALGGKASGLGTTTAVYRDLADTKDRITATVDSDGNRTAVTRDVT